MKANVLETQYPMLCEGTRRQRGDLALALLVHCRDNSARLRDVMDVLLDKNRYETPNAETKPGDKNERTGEEHCSRKQDGNNGTRTSTIPRPQGGFPPPPRRGRSISCCVLFVNFWFDSLICHMNRLKRKEIARLHIYIYILFMLYVTLFKLRYTVMCYIALYCDALRCVALRCLVM